MSEGFKEPTVCSKCAVINNGISVLSKTLKLVYKVMLMAVIVQLVVLIGTEITSKLQLPVNIIWKKQKGFEHD